MVADAIGRPPTQSPVDHEDEVLEPGLRENISGQLRVLLGWLQNRWVLLAIFTVAVIPFGFNYWGAYQDNNELQAQIDSKAAVLAEAEPPTDDIEAGLRTWTAAREAASEAQILELEDSSLVEKLFATASAASVSIQSISTSPNTIVPVGIEAYEVTPFILRVSGSVAGIESYMALLEGDAIDALEIQNSLVAPLEGDTFSGVIRAIVFNRPIDPSELDSDELEELSRRVTDEELDAAAAGSSGASRSGR